MSSSAPGKRKNATEDEEHIQLEPRKRKPTARLTDNADPLLKNRGPKASAPNAVRAPISSAPARRPAEIDEEDEEGEDAASNHHSRSHNHASTSNARSRRVSVEIEDIEDEEAAIRHPRPRNSAHIIESDADEDDEPYASQLESDVASGHAGGGSQGKAAARAVVGGDTDLESDDPVEETANAQLSE